MRTLTIQLPEPLRQAIEALAAKECYSVSQFLASAASEKPAVVLTMDYLRREAATGRHENFEKYLAAVPDAPPSLAMNCDHVLDTKQKKPATNTSALEREIDQQVHVLYGLTPEEIKAVENPTTQK